MWGTDGSIKTCDHLTFSADPSTGSGQVVEDLDGTVIGNGDKDFIFTGKQTLRKGTYEMRRTLSTNPPAESQGVDN